MALHSLFALMGASILSALEVLVIVRILPEYVFQQPCNSLFCASTVKVAWYLCGANYLLLCCYSLVLYPTLKDPLRNIPRVKFWLPRIVYHWLAGRGNQAQLLLAAARETPNDGLLALPELTRRRLLVTNTTMLTNLLVHNPYEFEKPENMRSFLSKIVGDGIFVTEGDQHRFLRKNSMHAFGFRRIKDLQSMMWKSSRKLMDALELEIKDNRRRDYKDGSVPIDRIEITAWANHAAMGIIGNAVFGREFSGRDNSDDSALLHNFRTIFDPTNEMLAYFVLSAWLSFSAVRLLPWRMNRVFSDTTATLRRICLKWVRERRKERQATNQAEDKRSDLLNLLLDPGILDDQQATDQLLTYMAAGHDTTALTFTWACYLLAIDRQQQAALRREVSTALADKEAVPSVHDTDNEDNGVAAGVAERLPLLNAIISETLRLYPAVPVTIRCATREQTLGGHRIPRDTELLVSPWVINRSRELWGDDADEFRPSRWMSPVGVAPGNTGPSSATAATGGADKYAMATFLHGPRSCIGQSFARAELRCLLAAMVTRFEWTLGMKADDVVPGGAITIRPQSGLYLDLKPLR